MCTYIARFTDFQLGAIAADDSCCQVSADSGEGQRFSAAGKAGAVRRMDRIYILYRLSKIKNLWIGFYFAIRHCSAFLCLQPFQFIY